MNIQDFVQEMLEHFDEPPNLVEQVELITSRLSRANDDVLRLCLDNLLKKQKAKQWPSLSIIESALAKARKQRAGGFAKYDHRAGDAQWDLNRGREPTFFIPRGSPPWLAWLEYRKNNGMGLTYMMSENTTAARALTVPSIWPPGYEHLKAEFIELATQNEESA